MGGRLVWDRQRTEQHSQAPLLAAPMQASSAFKGVLAATAQQPCPTLPPWPFSRMPLPLAGAHLPAGERTGDMSTHLSRPASPPPPGRPAGHPCHRSSGPGCLPAAARPFAAGHSAPAAGQSLPSSLATLRELGHPAEMSEVWAWNVVGRSLLRTLLSTPSALGEQPRRASLQTSSVRAVCDCRKGQNSSVHPPAA